VFSGVGKSPDEIERAVQLGLKAINAESAGELERIDRAAQARGVRARVAVRVNPDIDAGTHPHISTGPPHQQVRRAPRAGRQVLYRRMSEQPGLQPVAIHVHLGSQIISTEPIQRGAGEVVRLARGASRLGEFSSSTSTSEAVSGISYDGSRCAVGGRVRGGDSWPSWRPPGFSVALEPGRYIVGASGLCSSRVSWTSSPPQAAVTSPCSMPG
jgi:diaminopimelate decarboxylase